MPMEIRVESIWSRFVVTNRFGSKRGKGIASVAIRSSFYLVVADTGRAGDTRSAVGSIKHKLDKSPIQTKQSIDRIGQYTLDARNALIQGNLVQLGLLLNLAQTELEKLGVSDHGINHLVNIARNAGALGAKLTGGGQGDVLSHWQKIVFKQEKLVNS